MKKRKRRTGFYAIGRDGVQEKFERIDTDAVLVQPRSGSQLRVSVAEGKPGIEVYTTDGRIIVWPNVSNVITVGVEDR